jgi:glycosyltransferase involved in cell wall biosynthesis
LKVLLLHNRYQHPGGEDVVFRAEEAMLTAARHRVLPFVVNNDSIHADGTWQRVKLSAQTVWSRESYREVKALLGREKPDVAHFHNTFPLISPSAYYACREAGVPVVQTLHNYRLLCPAGTFRQNGSICQKCVTGGLSNGVLHGCYRDSRAATAATALMLGAHRWLGTWNEAVDCYVALTEFSRRKFIEGGLPAEKIVVKPNFVSPDPLENCSGDVPIAESKMIDGGPRSGRGRRRPPIQGEYALYVGRLSYEKGVRTLLRAWQKTSIPLHVVGDGPLRQELEAFSSGHDLSSVTFHGHVTSALLIPVMKRARFLVLPSEWYESFPVTLAEAFACGVPVIASRLGAMQEIVEDGRTGLHFTSGDADDLAAKVEWAWTHPEEIQAMGRAARAEYETKYTAERNYDMLMGIYQRVLQRTA